MNKKAFKFVTILCIILVFVGTIIVNNSMPKFIKDKSGFSIDYSFSPLDLEINTKNYSISFGKKIFHNFKDVSFRFTENIGKGIKQKTDTIVDGMDKTFEQIKSNIGH